MWHGMACETKCADHWQRPKGFRRVCCWFLVALHTSDLDFSTGLQIAVADNLASLLFCLQQNALLCVGGGSGFSPKCVYFPPFLQQNHLINATAAVKLMQFT